MATFKYIIVDSGAILFNESTSHKQVGYGFTKIYSAGFVTFKLRSASITEPKCFGESTSLEIKSQPKKDAQIIKDLFQDVSQIKYFNFSVKDFYLNK